MITVLLGRSKDCDLLIENDTVSRVHAQAWYENALECIVVKDKDSVNGTTVGTNSSVAGESIRVYPSGSVILGEAEVFYDEIFEVIDKKEREKEELVKKYRKNENRKKVWISFLIILILGALATSYFVYSKSQKDLKIINETKKQAQEALDEARALMLQNSNSQENNSSPQIDPTLLIGPYLDNKDGTITDTRTSLVWQKCPLGQNYTAGVCEGQIAQYTANTTAQAAIIINENSYAGKSDWYVPSRAELLTLATGDDSTNVYEEVFGENAKLIFWSSTPNSTNDGYWNVNFIDNKLYWEHTNNKRYLRLVRKNQ